MKICALLMALLLAIGLAACGEDNGDTGGDGTPPLDTGVDEEPPLDSTTTIDLQEIIDRVKEQNVPPTQARTAELSTPETGSSELAAVTSYLETVVQHADTIWTNWFAANGLTEPYLGYRIIQSGETFTSECTGAGGQPVTAAADYPNAFYCPFDSLTDDQGVVYEGVIVLPVETMYKMWGGDIFGQQSNFRGDFAAATIVAHEFGHHVVDEMMQGYGLNEPTTPKNNELIADCFAGVWAVAVYKDGLLDEGDVNEAVSALTAIGDYEILSEGHHGTPAERSNAWQIGYYGSEANPTPGVPANCMTAFWD